MDEELKVYLDGITSEMRDMKRELIAHTDASLGEAKREMIAHTDASLEQAKRELREHTEAVETRLLGEFFKWAGSRGGGCPG